MTTGQNRAGSDIVVAPTGDTVVLKIRRTAFDASRSPEATNFGTRAVSRWERFPVPVADPQMTVLDALIWAQQNLDQTIAFRCACRVGMCGTCGMVIDGREGLACRTRFRDLQGGPRRDRDFTVEPLRNLPVLRDLVCDLSGFYDKVRQALGQVTRRPGMEGIVPISPASGERRSISPQGDCIYCGLCYSACTVAGLDDGFLGPAALNRAFVAIRDSRNEVSAEAIAAVANEHGLWRCHTMYECTAVCPKGISPTLAIQALRRTVIAYKIKKVLGFPRTKS